MGGRERRWLSDAEAHVVASFGAALLVPTVGIVPIVLAARGVGGVRAGIHLGWASTLTSALIVSGALLGRVLPDLMLGGGPAWEASEVGMRTMGAIWMFVAFCTPAMLSAGHALAAFLAHLGVGVPRAERREAPRGSAPRPPRRGPLRKQHHPTEQAVLVIRSATARSAFPRLVEPALTAVPEPDGAKPVR